MTDAIQLDVHEQIAARPFTHPRRIAHDYRLLHYLADHLSLILTHHHIYAGCERPLVLSQPAFQRVVYADDAPTQRHTPLMLVGFFGERRPDADVALAGELDEMLVQKIPSYPGIYSYCTLELADGNYANMVLFNSPEAKTQWGYSRAHARAADDLAPHYYHSVRIYNGRLPAGITAADRLELDRVKYFDYQAGDLWQAVRPVSAEVAQRLVL